jgi:hypothetical protein
VKTKYMNVSLRVEKGLNQSSEVEKSMSCGSLFKP